MAASKVRVLIATTEGPVEIISLLREPAEIGQSRVVLLDDPYTPAELSGIYDKFVSRKTGVIGRLFGHDTFRLEISKRIDEGFSWQLGVLIAHGLEQAERLYDPDGEEKPDTVVLATGEVGWGELLINKVGFVERKLALAFDRLGEERAAGRRVIALWPKGNHDDAAPRIESLKEINVEIHEVEAAREAFAALDLPEPSVVRVAAKSAVPTWKGSPFRGLNPFDAEHRPVFFGRGQAREEALTLMRRAAAQDCAFLLIYGSSGSGKSSLVRAGLVGDIKQIASEADIWPDCIVSIGRGAAGPVAALASSLIGAIPGLKLTSEALGFLIHKDPVEAADRITHGLAQIDAGQRVKLILFVDQLEELFLWQPDAPVAPDDEAAQQAVEKSQRASARGERDLFAQMLNLLARSGAVWVIATLRSDLLPLLEDSPRLSRLAADERRYALKTPSRAELREIVQRPMDVAGIRLEGCDELGLPLGEVLVEAAASNPSSLPLLQFALARLYDNEGATGQISYATYKRIGRIEGAIGRWADVTVQSLGGAPEIERAVDDVLLALGRMERDGRKIVARTARPDIDFATPQRKEVIDALERARLVVLDNVDDAADGKIATVRVTHEALLTHWPRAQQVFAEHAGMLDLRDRLNVDAKDWIAQKRHESFLLRGLPLASAEAVLKGERVALSPEATEYIRASTQKAEAERAEAERRRQEREEEQARRLIDAQALAAANKRILQRTLVGLAAAVVLAIGMVWKYLDAEAQRLNAQSAEARAVAEKNIAQQQTKRAEEQTKRAEATRQDSGEIARLARRRLANTNDDYKNRLDDLFDWTSPAWRARLHHWWGGERASAGDFSAQRRDLDKALRIEPDYIPLLISSSDNFLALADADGAVRDADRALKGGAVNPYVYGNLILGEAMRRDYSNAIAHIDEALEKSQRTIDDTESLSAPEVEEFVGGFLLYVRDTDYLLALRYEKAALLAMSGDPRFKAALIDADHADRDYPFSRTAYLTALDWEWLILRGQALRDAHEAEGSDPPASAKQAEIRDYGAYAIEAALWARLAATRNDFADHSARAFARFKERYGIANGIAPNGDYRALAAWVDGEVAKPIDPKTEPDSPLDAARDLEVKAIELHYGPNSGTNAWLMAPALQLLSDAIHLLDPDRLGRKLGRREEDALIDLLLRRGEWRLSSKDNGGAAQDARRVLEIDPQIASAHRLLGDALVDSAEREKEYQEAVKLAPGDTEALSSLASIEEEENKPAEALKLLGRRRMFERLNSSGYATLARLQDRVGLPQDALDDIGKAIELAPWKFDYYTARHDYEIHRKLDPAVAELHYVEGLHELGEFSARTGNDSDGLRAFTEAFRKVAGLEETNATKFELGSLMKDFSGFLVRRFGRADAQRWWESFAQNPLATDREKQLSAAEAKRVANAR